MMSPGRSPGRLPACTSVWAAVLLVVLAIPGPLVGQQRGFGNEGGGRPITRGHPDIPGGFTFCRLQYDQVRREDGGLGWSTDYPGSDQNLTLRLTELTTTTASRWSDDGMQGIAVFTPRDPDLMRCPFLMASDAGTAGFDDREVENMREYFLKGGFLWADDFWGYAALDQFLGEMAKILPEYEAVELPMDHPLYGVVYKVEKVPQITAIQFFSGPNGTTSERGAESAIPKIYAIMDENERIMVLMSHNTDIADGWEREAADPEFFYLFSPAAYAIGVNVAVWVMTH